MTQVNGTLTATCADCDLGWRGAHAHELGEAHQNQHTHVVWYDEDPSECFPGEDWHGVCIDETHAGQR